MSYWDWLMTKAILEHISKRVAFSFISAFIRCLLFQTSRLYNTKYGNSMGTIVIVCLNVNLWK